MSLVAAVRFRHPCTHSDPLVSYDVIGGRMHGEFSVSQRSDLNFGPFPTGCVTPVPVWHLVSSSLGGDLLLRMFEREQSS